MANLADVRDVKHVLGEDFDATEAARAEALLASASAIIRRLTRKDFDPPAQVTETLDGSGTALVVLGNDPVTAVASVVEDGTTLTVTSDYVWYPDGRLVRVSNDWLVYPQYPSWGVKRQSIVVTYTHGYATVPSDIAAACASMVARAFHNPMGFQSETIGDYAYRLGSSGPSGMQPDDTELEVIRSYATPVMA